MSWSSQGSPFDSSGKDNPVDDRNAASLHVERAVPSEVRFQTLIEKVFSFARSLLTIVGHYTEVHLRRNFAGNLEALRSAYFESSGETRKALARRFDLIAGQLTLRNGVTKETYASRLSKSLSTVLAAIHLPTSRSIRVLDVPASTGSASLANLAMLDERGYAVGSYVLGDLSHWILFDPTRGCIFDDHGNLLQVALGGFFLSIYRGGVTGNEYTFMTKVLAFPHAAMSYCVRKLYRFQRDGDYRRLAVIHPEVEPLLESGHFGLAELDVFRTVPGKFDLILSFNLLQQNYFPPDMIACGVKNLADALCDRGFLVMGNTESYIAYEKRNGELVVRLREGRF